MRRHGGAGSSPAVPIKTNSKKVLRRMLRKLDKDLAHYDRFKNTPYLNIGNIEQTTRI